LSRAPVMILSMPGPYGVGHDGLTHYPLDMYPGIFKPITCTFHC
jgi:hypothetical protein